MKQHRWALFVSSVVLAACQATPTPGVTCTRTSDCHGSLVCRFGRCRAECDTNADCPPGSPCLLGRDGIGACGLDADLGCESGVGRTCPAGLVCVQTRCQQPCALAADCPSDATCLPIGDGTRFCFDGRASADAGLPDVALTDVGSDAPRGDASILRDGVLDVCIGERSACALSADRHVYCWGDGALGQLGGGDASCSAAPPRATPTTPVAGLSDVDAIGCGVDFACAHTIDGAVWCWGANDQAQLGRGNTSPCEATAAPVMAPHTLDQGRGGSLTILSVAGRHACVLDPMTDVVQCWGAADLVLPTMQTTPTTLVVPFDPADTTIDRSGLANLALGAENACIVTEGHNDVFCWGDASYGQVGLDPSTTPPNYANHPPLDAGALAIAAAGTFVCTLDLVGAVWCWGDAREARLGATPDMITALRNDCGPSGTDECTSVPNYFASATVFFSQLSSSPSGTSCGVVATDTTTGMSAGQVTCWGPNQFLQANGPSATTPVTLVTETVPPGVRLSTGFLAGGAFAVAGLHASCAVDVRGQLACWGDTDFNGASPSPIAIPITVPVMR